MVSSAKSFRPEQSRRTGHSLCFALSRSRFAPVCGAKVGFAAFFFMPQPPLCQEFTMKKKASLGPGSG